MPGEKVFPLLMVTRKEVGDDTLSLYFPKPSPSIDIPRHETRELVRMSKGSLEKVTVNTKSFTPRTPAYWWCPESLHIIGVQYEGP